MRPLFAWLLSLGLAIAACGDSAAEKVCIAGEKVGCFCDDGDASQSVCKSDGSGFTGCQCGSGGSSSTGPTCISGARNYCKCPDSSTGVQYCLDDGSGYGSCDCSTGPGGSGGSGGSGTSGSAACIPGGSSCQVTDTCCNGGSCVPLASGKNVCVQQ